MDLTKLFVLVDSDNCDSFVASHVSTTDKTIQSSDAFYKKVCFLQKSGEIVTAGQKFGASGITADELSKIQTALKGYLTGAETSNVAAAIKAITDNLGVASSGSGDSAVAATGLNKAVEANTAAIATLNGDAKTEGSVKKAVSDAIAGVVNNAPGAFDTLKEIAEWIAGDDGTVSMTAEEIITQVSTNTSNIGTAAVAASGDVEAKAATGLYKYIDDAVAGIEHTKVEASETSGKIKVNGTDITVVENPVSDADYKHITVTSTSVSAGTGEGTITFNQYVHPAYDAAAAAAIKVGRDATGHVTIGDALTASDITATAIAGSDTVAANAGTTVAAQITNIQTDLKTIDAYDPWETYSSES